MALTPRSESHWYSRDGLPQHEIPMASDPTRNRPVNLRDAKKLKLLPSVTTILKEVAKPFLEMWRIEQAIKAALANPVALSGESEDDHIHRIERAANSIVDEAAKRGVLIHEAIENFVLYGTLTADPIIRPLLEPYFAWHQENVIRVHYAEKTCVHDGLGYAGKLDLKAELRGRGLCIVDYKSRKRGSDGKYAVYPENGTQLAAYLEADALNNQRADRSVSIIINSETPDLHLHEWGEHERQWQAFTHLLSYWKLTKSYDPNA